MKTAFLLVAAIVRGVSAAAETPTDASASAAAGVPEQFRVWGVTAAPDAYLVAATLYCEAAVPKATVTERRLGFALLGGPAFAAGGGAEGPDDRVTFLAAGDCPGQYGPVSFRVLALRSIEISVEASRLNGPDEAFIPAACLDVRVVRSVRAAGDRGPEVFPLFVESFKKVRLAPRSLTRIWITYFVPEGALPGIYRGRIVVRSGAGRRQDVPVELEVRPFALVEPGADLYFYTGSTDDLGVLARELADQRLHGMNMGMVHPEVTRDGELVRERTAARLATYAAAGLARRRVFVPLENRITAEWLNDPDKTIGMWGPWMRYYPFSTALDRRYVDAVKFIRDEAARHGIRVVLAVGDEAGSHAWTIPAVRHYLELVKREVPDVVRELTVGGGWATGEDENAHWKGLLDVWTTNRWLADRLDRVRKEEPGVAVAVYNMGGAGSKPGGLLAARDLYGFFAWKARAAGVAQWVYRYGSTPEHNYAWLAAGGGVVPTLRWEAVREGVKDRRYLATIESRLAGRTGPAADAARALLDEIAAAIRLEHEDYDAVSGGRIHAAPPGRHEEWRRRLAEAIIRLDSGKPQAPSASWR